jgi:hypothetical protein
MIDGFGGWNMMEDPMLKVYFLINLEKIVSIMKDSLVDNPKVLVKLSIMEESGNIMDKLRRERQMAWVILLTKNKHLSLKVNGKTPNLI